MRRRTPSDYDTQRALEALGRTIAEKDAQLEHRDRLLAEAAVYREALIRQNDELRRQLAQQQPTAPIPLPARTRWDLDVAAGLPAPARGAA